MTRSRNWLPACCSSGSTRCWLPEVSSRIPSVSGRWVSAIKLLSFCGTLSSRIVQSSCVRCGTRLPSLSLTVKNISTRFTSTLRVVSGASSTCAAGAVLTGGASGEGASWPHATADSPGRPNTRAAIPSRMRMQLFRRKWNLEDSIPELFPFQRATCALLARLIL